MNSASESDDEGSIDEKRWGGVAGRILLVDVSEDMWKPRQQPFSDEEVLPLTVSVHSCMELARHLMVDAPTHLFGMAIFGTLKNDDKGLENVIQLLDLKQPTIEDIKTLKRICQDVKEIKNDWGTVSNYSFADALWQASRMFSSCKKKMSSQSVIILSCFSEPDTTTHRNILKKASDLHSLGIKITLINVSDTPIAEDSFFVEFGSIISNQSMSDYDPPTPTLDPEEIFPSIYESSNPRSASARIKFDLGDNVQIGIGIYHLCKSKNLPKKVTLHRETNSLVQSSTSKIVMSESIHRPVLLSELVMYQTYGDRRIELTHGELTQLRKFGGAPQMKLLGFKNATTFDMSKYYLKQSAFIYPDESSVTGSTTLFKCLRDRCIAKQCIPICIIVPRWYTSPRLVALVPQVRNNNESDGFHIIYLPYAENFKEVVINEHADVSNEQLECMRRIINKLKFVYNPQFFENPKLQTHYSALEALALDESEPRVVEDSTVPDVEGQDDRIGDFAETFNSLFGPFNVKPAKRPRDDEAGPSSRIRRPAESPDLQILKCRIDTKSVDKYKVDELKQILKWCNPPKLTLTGLKKNELVELVYQHCSQISL